MRLIVSYLIGLVFGRTEPVLANAFQVPVSRSIDARLLGGAVMFGIGWGITGFCPGGALPAPGTGRWEVFAFTSAVIGGIFLAKFPLSQGGPARRATA